MIQLRIVLVVAFVATVYSTRPTISHMARNNRGEKAKVETRSLEHRFATLEPIDFSKQDKGENTRSRREMAPGDTLPPESFETQIVGKVRDFIAPSSSEYDALTVVVNNDIIFFEDAKGESNRMASSLGSVLADLSAAIASDKITVEGRNDVRLGVFSSYRQAASAEEVDIIDLRYEGRAVHLVLVDINPSDGRPYDLLQGSTPLSWLAERAYELGADFTTITSLRNDIDFTPHFDGATINPRHVIASVTHEKCGAAVDLAFILDGSASVTRSALWDDQIKFVKDMIGKFEIARDETRVAILTCHGPLVSHFSLDIDLAPDCPDGTIWEADGEGCACPSKSAKCLNDGDAPQGQGCQFGNYELVRDACKDATDAEIEAGNVPNCELREFFGHGCLDCTCSELLPEYDEKNSYRVDARFDDASQSSSSLISMLDGLQSPAGATHLETCLRYAEQNFFDPAQGMRLSGEGFPRVAVVVSDGRSNPQFEPDLALGIIKGRGVKVYAIGVGEDIYMPELEKVASDPDVKHLFTVDDPDSLGVILNRLSSGTCEIPGILEASTSVTISLKPDEYRYFKGVCEDVNQLTDKIIIERSTSGGQTAVYASTTESNPSQFLSSASIDFSDDDATAILTRPNPTSDVYIAIRGGGANVLHVGTLAFYQHPFEDFKFAASVAENKDAGTLVTGPRPMASVNGYTPTYRYAIDSEMNGDGKFRIDIDTGAVTTAESLDREEKASYQIKIWATDETHLCVRGFQYMDISIANENDNKPQFTKKLYEATLIEDTRKFEPARRRVGDEIVKIEATDPDGGALKYYIVSGNDNDFFQLNEDTGVLTQIATVDFEIVGSLIELKVVAEDEGGQRSDQVTVAITVEDGNDAPTFTKDELVPARVFQNTAIGTEVAVIDILDDSFKDDVTCLIAEGNTNNRFKVETRSDSCVVLVQDSLSNFKDVEFDLQVQLLLSQDSTILDSKLQKVAVNAANLNPPEFTRTTYTIAASYLEPVGSVIVSLDVTDPDGNDISCDFLSGNLQGQFELTSDINDPCIIKLAKPFSVAQIGSFITLLVSASDGGVFENLPVPTATVRVEVLKSCPVTTNCKVDVACAEGLDVDCFCTEATAAGTECEIDFCRSADPSDSNPCENTARCRNLDFDYRCDRCPSTIGGKNCDEVTDKCQPNPCLNGGTCKRASSPGLTSLDTFECSCTDQFEGTTCAIEKVIPHQCDEANPCQNGGSCVKDGMNFQCSCTSGFFGETCSDTRELCDSQSSCADSEVNCKGDCANGQCVATSLGGQCNCDTGFSGSLCEDSDDSVDACESQPCQNGASCRRVSTTPNGPKDGFVCDCMNGYTGTLCDDSANLCSENPCENGATCERVAGEGTTALTSFVCHCIDDWIGVTCSVKDKNPGPCNSNPCQNDGTCIETRTVPNGPPDGFECACKDNFFGETCSETRDDCMTSNPCDADVEDCQGDCNDGTCEATEDGGECLCDDGFMGLDCQDDDTSLDACESNPCENGGVCERRARIVGGPKDDYTCICPEGYDGDDCENVINQCAPKPCKNGGKCTRVAGEGTSDLTDFTCECSGKFTGPTCTVPVSPHPCDSNPCKNGGVCLRDGSSYSCVCADNFYGRHCLESRGSCSQNNPCDPASASCVGDCLNGECVPTAAGGQCSCDDGFFGSLCETVDPAPDACASSPCVNGGTCIRTSEVPNGPKTSFVCSCLSGFSGDTCELSDQNCRQGVVNACNNLGVCTSSIEGGSCTCDNPNANECVYGSVCEKFEARPCSQVNEASGGGGNSGATIAGIVVGSLIGVILLIVLILLLVTHCGRDNKVTEVHPEYESEMIGTSFDNPTFVASGGVGKDSGVSNPFYGSNAAPSGNSTYAAPAPAPGTYDVVHKPTEPTYDSMSSNSANVQVQRGQLRLASVSRDNPINESSTDGPLLNQSNDGSMSNPMYGSSVPPPINEHQSGYMDPTDSPTRPAESAYATAPQNTMSNPMYNGQPSNGSAQNSMSNPMYGDASSAPAPQHQPGYMDPADMQSAPESAYATAPQNSMSNPMYNLQNQ